MSLYKKYRPNKLSQIVGNEEVVESLNDHLTKEEVPQVILLTGPTGCGKTTIGRIIAKSVGNEIHEKDSAHFTGVDVIRKIRSDSRFVPIGSGKRTYLMDEVHMLTSQAQNAFLKELEDAPKHTNYILCTTNPEKLIKTLVGRCIRYDLKTLSKDDMLTLLKRIVKKEKEKLDDKIYSTIVKNGKGHPRDTINILQKVLSVPKKKRLKIARQVEVLENKVIDLCRAMIQQRGWIEVQSILNGLKDNEDPENIRRSVLGYCSSVLLNPKTYSHLQAAKIMEEFIENTYDTGFSKIVFACYSVVYQQ